MSTNNRRRRKSNVPRPELARASQEAGSSRAQTKAITGPTPLPEWKWLTFPVYFAFAVGAFIGLFAGIATAATNNNTVQLVSLLGVSSLLGWGFSRFAVRWMMSRSWVKPRPKRKA